MEDNSRLASVAPHIPAASAVAQDPCSDSPPHPQSLKAFTKLSSGIEDNTLVLLDACPLS